MKKRIIACLLSGIMVVGTITGCGDSSNSSKTEKTLTNEEKNGETKVTDVENSKTNDSSSESNLTQDLNDYSDIEWPDSTVASMIPKPKSNIGKITLDSDDTIMVEIANISDEDFNNYIDECKDIGYVNDYMKTDYMYTASNDNGYEIVLSMYDDHVMSIMATPADK